MSADIVMLRAYYEREAKLGRRGGLSDRRIELRARFIAMLDAENRMSVLDVGAGPAQDGSGFVDSGFGYLAIDLAHENGRRSRARVLVPGAPCLLAQWGHEREEQLVSDFQSIGRSRPFDLRSFEHDRSLVEPFGEIESEECWTAASADWDYHVFTLRID